MRYALIMRTMATVVDCLMAQDVDAVHAGHDDVEQGEVGLLVDEHEQGIFARI